MRRRSSGDYRLREHVRRPVTACEGSEVMLGVVSIERRVDTSLKLHRPNENTRLGLFCNIRSTVSKISISLTFLKNSALFTVSIKLIMSLQ